MIIVGSTNADVGIQQGMDILKSGGSAMDAVEATIRLVEDNPDDHTVGYNSSVSYTHLTLPTSDLV